MTYSESKLKYLLLFFSIEIVFLMLASNLVNFCIVAGVCLICVCVAAVKEKKPGACVGFKKRTLIVSIPCAFLIGRHFFLDHPNSKIIGYMASLVKMSHENVLIICSVCGAILVVPALCAFASYCISSISRKDKQAISEMMNLASVLCYAVGFVMRSKFAITHLLYFSHFGGFVCVVISLIYAFAPCKKTDRMITWRYISVVFWTLIFLYTFIMNYIFGDYSGKSYFFSIQTFYHVIAPIISVFSYFAFEDMDTKISHSVLPVTFVSVFCALNILLPPIFKVKVMYKLANLSKYGGLTVFRNGCIIVFLSWVVCLVFMLVSRLISVRNSNDNNPRNERDRRKELRRSLSIHDFFSKIRNF